jgi:hypothetical protein
VTIFAQKGHFRENFELVMWGIFCRKKEKASYSRTLLAFSLSWMGNHQWVPLFVLPVPIAI